MTQDLGLRGRSGDESIGFEADADDRGSRRAPICFVVDEDSSIRHFLSLILHGAGIDTEEFADGAAMRKMIEQRTPDLVFINVGLDTAEVIETIVELGKFAYPGFIQLMSTRGAAVLDHVKSIGA